MSTTKGIDFSSLSLRDALDLAVLIEEEARDRYVEFAEQMEVHHTPEAARFFRFMSGNEEKHRAELAERREQLFGNEPSSVSATMIFDVEAPEYDEARVFMSAREALGAAMRSERKAHAFFVGALEVVQDADVRALFDELREEEVEHQQLVQVELDKLPPESGFATEDFADGPVAH